jgi:hypothetical protein
MSFNRPRYLELLENFDSLPLTAIVPIPVAAAWRGISEKTIRRNFQLVATSEHRRGVRKSDLTNLANLESLTS